MAKVSGKRRNLIKKRDNHSCVYCGDYLTKDNIHIDHVIPKSKGGKNDINNLALSCKPCNLFKGCLTVQEFREKIKNRYNECLANLEYYNKILTRFEDGNI